MDTKKDMRQRHKERDEAETGQKERDVKVGIVLFDPPPPCPSGSFPVGLETGPVRTGISVLVVLGVLSEASELAPSP